YREYSGSITSEWSRFLVLPRYAYRDIFKSRVFISFFISSFIFPLGCAVMIYLRHNASALAILGLRLQNLVPIDADFFYRYVFIQGMFSFFMAMFIGPTLVSSDLTNNALPLYLCRPFSRTEYVLGKMSVSLILMSLITWVPGLLLFIFQSSLEGGWFIANYNLAGSVFVGSAVWILILSFLSPAGSAWVKLKMGAKGALLGLFFIPSVFAEIINLNFDTQWGNLISIRSLIKTVWAGLFDRPGRMELPLWSAWAALVVVCFICLILLMRKVKAYEVV